MDHPFVGWFDKSWGTCGPVLNFTPEEVIIERLCRAVEAYFNALQVAARNHARNAVSTIVTHFRTFTDIK